MGEEVKAVKNRKERLKKWTSQLPGARIITASTLSVGVGAVPYLMTRLSIKEPMRTQQHFTVNQLKRIKLERVKRDEDH